MTALGKSDVHSRSTLRAPFSGTFLQRKDVVNQCLEFGAEYVLGLVGLPYMGSRLCVTDRDDTGGRAVGGDQSVVGRW